MGTAKGPRCYKFLAEDVDPELREEFLRNGDFFNVEVTLDIPRESNVITVPCAVLLHDGERFVSCKNNVSPGELLEVLAPRIISYARELIKNKGNDVVVHPRMLTFALLLCAVPELLYEEKGRDLKVPDVAATKEAVEVLEQVPVAI